MRSDYFLVSDRLGFRAWREEDLPLATGLWTDARVMGLLGGPYTPDRICRRLERETATQLAFEMQYWPIFLLADGARRKVVVVVRHGRAPRRRRRRLSARLSRAPQWCLSCQQLFRGGPGGSPECAGHPGCG